MEVHDSKDDMQNSTPIIIGIEVSVDCRLRECLAIVLLLFRVIFLTWGPRLQKNSALAVHVARDVR